MIEIKVNIALTEETTETLKSLIQALHVQPEEKTAKKKSTKKKEEPSTADTETAEPLTETPITTETAPPQSPSVPLTTTSSAAPPVVTVQAPSPQAPATQGATAPAAATVQAPSPQVPTQAVTYTAQQLAVAGGELMDAGKQNELLALLAQFGVPAITSLDPAYYPAFAEGLRSLGARI